MTEILLNWTLSLNSINQFLEEEFQGDGGLQIRVHYGKLFSSFLIQNICCGYSKEPSQ